MFRITTEPLDALALMQAVGSDAAGAIALFAGVVRDENLGRRVEYLEYDAYPPMAEKKMAEIGDELRVKFGADRVVIFHRTGVLGIGEASVGIGVATPHRKEAFVACQYAIDRLKEIVPIWKKEVWSDDSHWIGWEGQAPIDAAAPAR